MALLTDALTPAALAARAVALQADQADELVGRRRSRAAFRRWGHTIPAALGPAGDLEILADRHAVTWLRRAEAFARDLDPELAGRGFHVADYDALGITSTIGSGFAFPAGLFEVVQHRLPAGAEPGHVLAVNLPAHAETVTEAVDDTDEAALAEAIAVSLCATVVHELAHLADHDAAGRHLPPGITFEVFRQAVAKPVTDPDRLHGPQWIRAYAHAMHRADRLRPAYFWWRVFRDDLRRHTTACPGDITVALDAELADLDAPLVGILRRPPPAAFANLFATPAAPAA